MLVGALVWVLVLVLGWAEAQQLPGGPGLPDNGYNLFLKQGPAHLSDQESLLSKGHPLPLHPAQSLLSLCRGLQSLPQFCWEKLGALAIGLGRLWGHAGLASLCMLGCGVAPALLLPRGLEGDGLVGGRGLERLVAFSVGTLLGDVFLHLLPETYAMGVAEGREGREAGLWVLLGLVFCFLLEKLLARTEEEQRRLGAWLNLAANVVDNASHGLAIGGSFLVSPRCGWATTAAILLHEIPHEISDFTILLRGDFCRWEAVRAQALTALAAVAGAAAAMSSGMGGEDETKAATWILPFTAGGFLNIALVQLLPEILREEERREAIVQLLLIFLGIATMQLLNSALFLL